MKKVLSVIALVLTLLAFSNAFTMPELTQCTHAYSGVGQPCSGTESIECLGESTCVHPDQFANDANSKGICYPKQIFVNQDCKYHYECYKALESTSNPALYCDSDTSKCKFTLQVDEVCTDNVQCQSQYCRDGVCALKPAGYRCNVTSDCYPFESELHECDQETFTCVAKVGLNQNCSQVECISSLECFEQKCREHKKEGDACEVNVNIRGNICRESGDGVNDLLCYDDKCTYPRYLRDKCSGVEYGCVSDYALECDGEYGTCQNKHCTEHSDCGKDEFCDCTNLICQNKNYGNKVHQCSFVDGTRNAPMTAFKKCLNEKCPGSAFVDSVVMLNKKSCAYQECRKAYQETADCIRKAGETYGAKDIYFFGL